MTHDEAKRLADMIRSPDTRQEITEHEWRVIADVLRKHNRPAQPPVLDDRDGELTASNVHSIVRLTSC
jgi:transposase